MAEIRSLAVWVGPHKVGRLERAGDHVFAYHPDASPSDAVSLTMPVRLKSWQSRDLHPVFQMNLPEGALLVAVRSAIAKVAGTDDMRVLRVVGGNTIGRNRFSRREDDAPMFPSEPESLEESLSFPDALELFNELVARYALRSGVSGVQPKVLLPATERATAVSSGFIVKSWGRISPTRSERVPLHDGGTEGGTGDSRISSFGERRSFCNEAVRYRPWRSVVRL